MAKGEYAWASKRFFGSLCPVALDSIAINTCIASHILVLGAFSKHRVVQCRVVPMHLHCALAKLT